MAVDERFCIHDLEWNMLPNGQYRLQIVGVKTLPQHLIACVPAAELEAFAADDQKVQLFGETRRNESAYKPVVDEICLASTESGWWGRVMLLKEYNDGSCQVYWLDYGSQCRVRATGLRKLGQEIGHKVRTIIFHVDGVDSYRQKRQLFNNRNMILANVQYNRWTGVNTIVSFL